MHARTMNEAVQNAAQALTLITPSKPTPRLPLATPVTLLNSTEAVISGHSTASANTYRVSWFDRRLWTVRHKWVEKGAFTVQETKTTTEVVA